MVERIAKASKVPVLNTHKVLERKWTSSGQSPLCRGFCRHTPHAAMLQLANVREAYDFQYVHMPHNHCIVQGNPKASIPLPFSVSFLDGMLRTRSHDGLWTLRLAGYVQIHPWDLNVAWVYVGEMFQAAEAIGTSFAKDQRMDALQPFRSRQERVFLQSNFQNLRSNNISPCSLITKPSYTRHRHGIPLYVRTSPISHPTIAGRTDIPIASKPSSSQWGPSSSPSS